MVTGILAKALEENRDRYNQIFYGYKRKYPSLDGNAFKNIISGFLFHTVSSVETVVESPKLVEAIDLFYELLLELLSQDFIGSNSKHPLFWQNASEIFLSLSKHTVSSSSVFVPSILNALYKIIIVYNADVTTWKNCLLNVAKLTEDVDLLLKAGQVAAWRSGLAHYRVSALELAKTLPEDLLYSIFDVNKTKEHKQVSSALDDMLYDPWLSFENALMPNYKKSGLDIKIVETFAGFGGKLTKQPKVLYINDSFIIRMGSSDYRLYSDFYGSVLIKTTIEEQLSESSPLVKIDHIEYKGNGEVYYRNFKRKFTELEKVSSKESFGTTMVVSTPYSYNLYVVYLK